jgi:hypothetical protein
VLLGMGRFEVECMSSNIPNDDVSESSSTTSLPKEEGKASRNRDLSPSSATI